MNYGKLRLYTALLLVMLGFSGCGFIKGWFPDKERDYQFRSEIPDLIVPDDLKSGSLPARMGSQAPAIKAAEVEAAESQQVQEAAPKKAAAPRSGPKAAEPESAGAETPEVQVAVSSAAVSSLHIDQARNQAWRLVARALSRQRIEIVERNLDKGYFYVKYDPNEIKPEDKSIWDEFTFLFGDDPSHEQEYRISLLELNPQSTEVTVQNTEGKTVSTSSATRLLKAITDGIKQDSSTNTRDNVGPQ